MRSFEWQIEDIVGAHPGLYLDHCAVMAVAILSQQSPSPFEFVVGCEGFSPNNLGGEKKFHLKIGWKKQTALKAERVLRTEQPRPIVERAAVAIAALAFAHLVPDGQMVVTRQGEHADYWLPRLECALEISGTELTRELAPRHRIKKAQLLANPLGWNGYVFICCFNSKQRVIRWSFHTQEVSHATAY